MAPQLRVLSCATCPHSSKLRDPPSAAGGRGCTKLCSHFTVVVGSRDGDHRMGSRDRTGLHEGSHKDTGPCLEGTSLMLWTRLLEVPEESPPGQGKSPSQSLSPFQPGLGYLGPGPPTIMSPSPHPRQAAARAQGSLSSVLLGRKPLRRRAGRGGSGRVGPTTGNSGNCRGSLCPRCQGCSGKVFCFFNQLLELTYDLSDIAPGVRASIHVLWFSSVRGRHTDLCFRRHIPSGLDYSEAPLEASASRSAAGPVGDGPGGAHAAAAVAAVAPRLPAPRCRLPGRLPLLQRHGGVRRPAAARRPARNPTRDAGGHRVGPAARREGRVGARWRREPPPRREQSPTSLRPADAVPAGQQHRAPGPRHPGASRRPAPPLPTQQQPARPGAWRLPRAVMPAGTGAHREPAARPASRRLRRPGSAARALPGG